MRRFIIAPDSFKGTMTAIEVCDILADAMRELVPEAEIVKLPMSDGGEGMVDAYLHLKGGEKRFAQVTGPKRKPVNCPYAILPDGTAVMEMAGCAGLSLLKGKPDPLHTTTWGVGEMLKLLDSSGVTRVLLGLGDGAAIDCGIGMAAALGYRFLDGEGAELEPVAGNIRKVSHIVKPESLPGLEIIVACNVSNSLLGLCGTCSVFGPGLGLTPRQTERMEKSFEHFAGLIREELGVDVSSIEGGGAGGGLGAALAGFCGGKLRSGIDMLLEAADFDTLLKGAEMVITGEGRIDTQTTMDSKIPVALGRRAKQERVTCVAVCGSIGPGAEMCLLRGVSAYYSACGNRRSLDEIRKTCREELRLTTKAALADIIF